jgi:pantothenate kinase-related protein Tda10
MEFARAYAAHIRLAQYLSEEGDGELPFVALFAGPSGHGKTLLASKGELIFL